MTWFLIKGKIQFNLHWDSQDQTASATALNHVVTSLWWGKCCSHIRQSLYLWLSKRNEQFQLKLVILQCELNGVEFQGWVSDNTPKPGVCSTPWDNPMICLSLCIVFWLTWQKLCLKKTKNKVCCSVKVKVWVCSFLFLSLCFVTRFG